MIKSELNLECGIRLKECLDDFPMTQNELSELTGYTQQYISNIVVGKKPMTIKAAKLFSSHLKVREAYLLAEDDYKTLEDAYKKRISAFNKQEGIALELLHLAGFEPLCNFIGNWKELGLDHTIYGPFVENDTAANHTSPILDSKLQYLTEIKSPNGKIFYCDTEDIELLSYELVEYIRFRMKQLESKYAWKYDCGQITPKSEGSEIYTYNVTNASEMPDFLSNSIWVSHEDNFFPHINHYDEKTE